MLAVPASADAASSKGTRGNVVATARGTTIVIYRHPMTKYVLSKLSSIGPAGNTRVLLVKSRRPGWEEVYLPSRPNESTGWVTDSEVTLANDPYRIQISLDEHKLTVWKNGRLIGADPAGVGTAETPTPTGRFYLVELLRQPDPSGPYGPYAFGLSAFSNVLFSFGGGPGEIGIHGTDVPSGIGTAISHGCIRLSTRAITHWAHILPLGTPVVISA
jgi:lipoprotein-anchoring transpeptidase ErfK/SrfK